MSFNQRPLPPAWRYFLSYFEQPTPRDLEALEARTGHIFQYPQYLCQALTHRSAITAMKEKKLGATHLELTDLIKHNEELEFLGDSLLSLAISTWLWNHTHLSSEGNYSRIRAYIVKEESLAQIAKEYQFGRCLFLNGATAQQGGREQSPILADALEAFLGAVYLDSGFDKGREIVEKLFEHHLSQSRPEEMILLDHKTRLQEITQKHYGCVPEYKIISQEGPDHNKNFVIECRVRGRAIAIAEAKSKKKASQLAAEMALGHDDFSRFRRL